jgi:ribonuclease E
MLPWLVVVLLVLNLTLFWWGRQHEIPIEPELPPIAEAPYQIRLLGEESAPDETATAEQPAETQVPGADTLTAPAAGVQEQAQEPSATDELQGAAAQGEAPSSDSERPAPDEGALPEPAPFIEHLGPPTEDTSATSRPPVYFPDPDPSEIPAPPAEPQENTSPAPDAAPTESAETGLPAAAAAAAASAATGDQPKPATKRKKKRHKRRHEPTPPVEVTP